MECKIVSPDCPVHDTVYGYAPNLVANTIFVAIFAICAISQVILGIIYRVRTYSIVVCLGCIGETIGYIGRILLHQNAWDNGGFIMQILLLIVSPSFLAAGIYLTLKHLVLHYGPQHSWLKPVLYTWVFVTCDAVGFLTQVVGGGIQASAPNEMPSTMAEIGNKIMVVGVTFQAVTMLVCGVLAIDFAQRVWRHRGERVACETSSPRTSMGMNFFTHCTVAAYVAILVRCIYRIPEMAAGWGNKMMRNEIEFMILDSTMIGIGAILLTVAHPRAYFPSIAGHPIKQMEVRRSLARNP